MILYFCVSFTSDFQLDRFDSISYLQEILITFFSKDDYSLITNFPILLFLIAFSCLLLIIVNATTLIIKINAAVQLRFHKPDSKDRGESITVYTYPSLDKSSGCVAFCVGVVWLKLSLMSGNP